MAKCRTCGTDIPEGAEYCAECLSKLNTAKNSESYLDSLLSAVMTEEPKRREIVFPKKEASSLVSVPENRELTEAAEDEEAPIEERLEPLEEETDAADFLQEFFDVPEEEPEEEPPMEDVFGTFFDAETDLPDLKNYSIFGDVDEGTVDRMLAEDLGEPVVFDDSEEFDTPEKIDAPEAFEVPELFGEEEPADVPDAFDPADLFSMMEETEPAVDEPEEMEEVPLSDVGNIEDLFGSLEDERGADAPKEIEMAEPEVISPEDLDAAADTFSGIVEEPEEETIPEFGDFADLFGSNEEFVQDKAPAPKAAPTDDFADLFAGLDGDDGLFEFGSEPVALEEPEEETDDLLTTMAATVSAPEETEEKEALAKGGKKKKGSGGLAALYHKLFDNVKVDPSKIKQPPTKEEIEAKKREKEEAKAKAKEEKEAVLAEKKEQDRLVKQEKQRVKKEAKAEKKAKKMEEAKLLLEEMEKTRINRAGASIVFIFFAMIAVVIIVGTSIFSYSLSIKNAEYEFENDRYTAAYNEIYGLDVKDEDILLYDRIMTVMYVQKQLNSYDNYYRMNDKPKALDSLLKGLQRYEKYIDLAVDLEVDTDLDSVRKKILEKINESFMLTEQEAMEIIQSDSQAEYSKKVYDAVDNLE